MFVPQYGTTFAAISTTVLLTLYAFMTFAVLKKIIGTYITKTVFLNVVKILCCGAAALAVYAAMRFFVPELVLAKNIVFVLPIIVCGIVYLACGFSLGLHKQLLKSTSRNAN